MKNREQRRAESKAKPVDRLLHDKNEKKTALRVGILILAAVMLLGAILMPFL